MRLDAVDDVFVGFEHHDESRRAPVPHEHVPAVRAADDVLTSPEVGLLDHGARVAVAAVGLLDGRARQRQLRLLLLRALFLAPPEDALQAPRRQVLLLLHGARRRRARAASARHVTIRR